MPIFINDKQVTIQEIEDHSLKTEDKVMSMLKQNLSYFKRRFEYRDGEEQFITLKWSPGVRKYNKLSKRTEGKKAIFDKWITIIQTPQGTKVVRYCENAIPQATGGYKYLPKGGWFRGSKVYGMDNIEYLLFITTFLRSVRKEMIEGEIINPRGPITVEDIALDQRRLATERTESSELYTYIYSTLSPLKDSPDTLRTLAMAWGVNKAGTKPIEQVKNSLYDKVMTAESKKDPRYNVAAFIAAVKEDNEFFDKLIMIQKGIDFKVLYFDNLGKRWCYMNQETHDLAEIVIIPGTMMKKRNEFLADHFMTNRKDFRQLEKTVMDKIAEKEGRQILKTKDDPEPDPDLGSTEGEKEEKTVTITDFKPNTDFVVLFEEKKISYPQLKSLVAEKGGKSVGVKANKLAESLTRMYAEGE